MARFDKRGNPISYAEQQAIDALDHAFDLLHAYQADPLAEVDKIIVDHPDFAMAHAFRAGALATATDKAFEPELMKSVEAAEALASESQRPRADAYFRGARVARRRLGAGDRTVGPRVDRLSARPAGASVCACRRLLPRAFAHAARSRCPCAAALESRHAGLWLRRRDVCVRTRRVRRLRAGRGTRSRGCRLERSRTVGPYMPSRMSWRCKAGLQKVRTSLRAGADAWAPNSMFAFHLWWHKALFHIDANDAASALKLFDEKISAAGSWSSP